MSATARGRSSTGDSARCSASQTVITPSLLCDYSESAFRLRWRGSAAGSDGRPRRAERGAQNVRLGGSNFLVPLVEPAAHEAADARELVRYWPARITQHQRHARIGSG